MFKKRQHAIFKVFSRLVLFAHLFYLLFGSGIHFHPGEQWVNDSSNIQTYFHAHESHKPLSERAENDQHEHQHTVIDAELNATRLNSNKTTPEYLASDTVIAQKVSFLFSRDLDTDPLLLDLPPPRPIQDLFHTTSFAYRGPPTG